MIVGALIMLNPTGLYPWIKAIHIIAVIAWMAGMLYLPRLFVYHTEAEPGSNNPLRVHLQNMDRTAQTVQSQPAPENARTKHLGSGPIKRNGRGM